MGPNSHSFLHVVGKMVTYTKLNQFTHHIMHHGYSTYRVGIYNLWKKNTGWIPRNTRFRIINVWQVWVPAHVLDVSCICLLLRKQKGQNNWTFISRRRQPFFKGIGSVKLVLLHCFLEHVYSRISQVFSINKIFQSKKSVI